MRIDPRRLWLRLAVGLCCLFISGGRGEEPVAIRWEAEAATETNMKTDGSYHARDTEGRAKLSGGVWLNGRNPKEGGLFAVYTVEVPADSSYQFFVRKFWHHGPFRFRFDDAPWVKVTHQPPILDSVVLMKYVPICWVQAGKVTLKAGEHALRLELLHGDEYQFSGNYGLDCFLLYDGDELPEGPSGLKANLLTTFSKLPPMKPTPAEGWKPTLVVDQSHPAANDNNQGTPDQPLQTINAAAERAKPGDIVLVHPGVYQETVAPAQSGAPGKPIRYVAASPGKVIVRGSVPWNPAWKRLDDKRPVFSAPLDMPIPPETRNPFQTAISIAPQDANEKARPVAEKGGALWPRTLGQVFVNGSMYVQTRQAGVVDVTPGTWIVAADGESIRVHFRASDQPAANPLLEVSVRKQLFAPAGDGFSFIQVKGFVFEHCANQGPFPQNGAVSVRGGHHWRIEENVIRSANTIGLDCGKKGEDPAGYNLIIHNRITDNGLCGIAGIGHVGTQIRNNVVERNNALDFDGPEAKWAEWAGIKLHMCDEVIIDGNLVRNNEAYGIWLDNQYRNARVSRNVVLGNAMAGIFFELGDGPALIDRNIIAHTRPRGHHYSGDGIYAHDASGLTIAHNLIYANAADGVRLVCLTNRKTRGHQVNCSNSRVLNNLILENNRSAVSLPYPNARAENNSSDYNVLFGTQEFWEGLHEWPALMAVNRFRSSVSKEQVLSVLRQALTKHSVPKGEWPGMGAWPKNPVLSLKLWRLFMQQDLHSVESGDRVKVALHPQQCLLDLKVKKDFLYSKCPKVEGIDSDFFGNPLPEAGLRAGPFQNLREGSNQLGVWPPPR